MADLRCDIREQLIEFLQKNHPTALPHARAETLRADQSTGEKSGRDERPPRTAAR